MAGQIDARLEELGIRLPDAAAAAGNYVPYVISGNMVFISGQIPLVDGVVKFVGRVGIDFSVPQAQEAAKTCALNILGQLKDACGGDLDRVVRIVKLGGFVNSTADFKDQPKVINGASDLMVEVFGDRGRHSRAAVSAVSLPLGVAVEVDAVIEIA